LLDLLLEGEVEPTAHRVAERAGVSVRSVYGHFASVAALHRAAIEQVTGEVLARLEPVDPDGSSEVKADLICGQRARINEDLGPLLLAAERNAAGSPELTAARRYSQQSSLSQIERIFDRELSQVDAGSRRRRVACIEALLGPHTWTNLRGEQRLAVEESRVALREAVLALLPGTR
jgi:AcrR family transcriptional regulator